MKINIKNTEKLQAAIDLAQKGCSARIVEADDVAADLGSRTKELLNVMCKKDLVGIKTTFDINAQSFPASYNGCQESTIVEAEYFPSGWFVTSVYRSSTRASRLNELTLNEHHKAAIAHFVAKHF